MARRPCVARRSSSEPTSNTRPCAWATTTKGPASSSRNRAARCYVRAELVEIGSPRSPFDEQRREPRILLQRSEIGIGLHLLGVLVLVLDRAGDLLECAIDLAHGGIGARGGMLDVGV